MWSQWQDKNVKFEVELADAGEVSSDISSRLPRNVLDSPVPHLYGLYVRLGIPHGFG